MKAKIGTILLAAVVAVGSYADTFGSGANEFELTFENISSGSNPSSGDGQVGYDYGIGTHEITYDQWSKYRNASGGPVGSGPGYSSSPSTRGNEAVNKTSWYEAAQFVNWLNTSSGHQAAYSFDGSGNMSLWGAGDQSATSAYRHKDAVYVLPSIDEWVKAAYWNGTSLQTYATPGDTVPAEGTEGANYRAVVEGIWNVGSGAEELNGTYDMMGNATEWNESAYTAPDDSATETRVIRGGHWSTGEFYFRSTSIHIVAYPTREHYGTGFRVAAISHPPPGEIGVVGSLGTLADGGSESLGNQAVGIGKTVTFTISNDAIGDATSLGDLSISIDGADAEAFAVGAISAESLGNGQSTTFRVTFTPSSAGTHSAAIHIASNDEDESPFDINLSGVGLANSDSEPGSDAWEVSNGFSPSFPDYYSLDSDSDGIPDIWEIYRGWPRYPSFPAQGFATSMSLSEVEDQNGFINVHTSSNGILKVQYRRSTTQTALIAHPVWTSNLSSNAWKYSGESDLGAVVSVSETIVSNGVDFEIVESAAEVTGGETDALFFSLELTPNE